VKKESANTAGIKAGITDHQEFVILDCITTQDKPGAVRNLIYQTGLLDGRKTQIVVAHDPGQAGIDQMERYDEKLRGLNFAPFKERDLGSKEERASNHATEGELHKIYVVENKKWNNEYIEEHIDFPQGKFKDRVDGTSMAYAVLFKVGMKHIKAHKIFGKLAGE
jgi:predicted phage terminase large subunit-like protein